MNAGETLQLSVKMCDRYGNPTTKDQMDLKQLRVVVSGDSIDFTEIASTSAKVDSAIVAKITKAGKHELNIMYGEEQLEIAVDYEEEVGVSEREIRKMLPLSVASGYAHHSRTKIEALNFKEESKSDPIRAGEAY